MANRRTRKPGVAGPTQNPGNSKVERAAPLICGWDSLQPNLFKRERLRVLIRVNIIKERPVPTDYFCLGSFVIQVLAQWFSADFEKDNLFLAG